MNQIDKNHNQTFEDIKRIMKMVLNFGMLENLCQYYNIPIGKTSKK